MMIIIIIAVSNNYLFINISYSYYNKSVQYLINDDMQFILSITVILIVVVIVIHWVMKPTQKTWAELRARHPKTCTFAMFDGIQISIL